MSLLITGILLCSMSMSDIKEKAVHEVMNVTAYTANVEDTGKTKGDPEYNVTSSGTQASKGVTISASKDIPFGTKVYIPYFDELGWNNHGVFTVEDRGGAITKGHIDVYMKTTKEARQFGRRRLDAYILGRCDAAMDEEKEEKQDVHINDPIESDPASKKEVYPILTPNRIKDYSAKLIVICTVCNDPLGIPRDMEQNLLYCEWLRCPTCRQRSRITKELKHFIVQY